VKPTYPAEGNGRTMRLACCIPFCRRTFKNDKAGTPWPEGAQVMCGKHWRMVSRDRRRRYSRLHRLWKNKKGAVQGEIADRIVRLLNDEFERFKKIATEAAAGIG
jgi:hypothetical protein